MNLKYLYFFVCYIAGSIPFGLLLVKYYLKTDIRNTGSGNIGATNVSRSNIMLGAVTLLLDFSKAFIPLLIIKNIINIDDNYLLLLMPTLGHVFSLWLKFKGGKGVATAFGTYWAYDYRLGVIATVTWLIAFIVFRYSSLSAISMAVITAVTAYFLYDNQRVIFIFITISIISIVKHHNNIINLVKK